MVIENRLALDYLLAAQDGIFALLNNSCWFYGNADQKNEADKNKIKTHLKVLCEVRQGIYLGG